jgi:hypothetical protein
MYERVRTTTPNLKEMLTLRWTATLSLKLTTSMTMRETVKASLILFFEGLLQWLC